MRDGQKLNLRQYRYLDLVTALFVTVLIISNVASSAKIIDWGATLFNMPLAFDAGTILFPLSYIFGDILTEVYGYRRSRRVIWTGFLCLGLTSLAFWTVKILPGEEAWMAAGGPQAFTLILGGMSSGGIVLASLAAYFAGEFSNSIILAKLKVVTSGKWLWLRTISSTLVGEGIDTVIFILIASIFKVFPWQIFSTLIVTNYIFKVGVEVLMTPLTYWIVSNLKRVEKEDYYDRMTNFSPFRF